jgi:Predicted enzyme related to lactoylglutathione lyase
MKIVYNEKIIEFEEAFMIRYVHTNIIAKDSDKLIDFYKKVFGCRSIGETRDLRGEWLDKMTGISNAHIVGEHLVLPGYDDDHPTLEIFSYDEMKGEQNHSINTYGFAHIAFEVDDVEETLNKLLQNGGKMKGELVHANYEDGRKATFVYATDIEGNIIELQSWS